MAFEFVLDPITKKVEFKETGRPPSDMTRRLYEQRSSTIDQAVQKKATEGKENPPPSTHLPTDQISLTRQAAMSQAAAEMDRKKSSKELRGDAETSAPEETDTVQFSNKAEQTLTQKDKFKHSSGHGRTIDPR